MNAGTSFLQSHGDEFAIQSNTSSSPYPEQIVVSHATINSCALDLRCHLTPNHYFIAPEQTGWREEAARLSQRFHYFAAAQAIRVAALSVLAPVLDGLCTTSLH